MGSSLGDPSRILGHRSQVKREGGVSSHGQGQFGGIGVSKSLP